MLAESVPTWVVSVAVAFVSDMVFVSDEAELSETLLQEIKRLQLPKWEKTFSFIGDLDVQDLRQDKSTLIIYFFLK